jgi:type I restriction enzyme M protein
MITGPLKAKVDKLWEEFWTGGITNPLTVIEQISFLAFARLLDIRESTEERKWRRLRPGRPFKGLFGPGEQELRWQNFTKLGGEAMLPLVRDKVFPHFRRLGPEGGTFGQYMKDALLLIQKPSLLVSAVSMIERLPLTGGDTKGDLYEYLLSKLTTAGINGQFRTPRHIIELIVDLVEPTPTDVVGDPACGTGGFLVEVMLYLKEKYTSEAGRIPEEIDGMQVYTNSGDLLEPYREHIQNRMFHGFDFDVTMLRIAAMNLMLHGVDRPDVHYMDTLSNKFMSDEKLRAFAADSLTLAMANPPFKGSLDESDVHPSLTGKVKTRKTELLFLVLLLRMLKLGGRCAVIVPDGVLFGSTKAHVELRKMLVEENQLDAVVKLPAGVFKPYAGVSTAVLMFTKGGRTEHVWFYDVQADGFSLDDKRDSTPDKDDLPDVRVRWKNRDARKDTDRTAKAFFVPKADIVGQNYDLSLGRYKEVVHEEKKTDPPKVILGRLKKLEAEITTDLEELEAMLG